MGLEIGLALVTGSSSPGRSVFVTSAGYRSPDPKAVPSGGKPPRLQPLFHLEVPREESAGLEATLTQS